MSSQHPMQTRELRTVERGVRLYTVRVDGSAVAGGSSTTNGLTLGGPHMLITENGAGDYTLVLNEPGERIVGVMATSITAGALCTASSTGNNSVSVLQTTASTGAALADADFDCWILASTAADET